MKRTGLLRTALGISLVPGLVLVALASPAATRPVSATPSGVTVGQYSSDKSASTVNVTLTSAVPAGDTVIVTVMVVSPASVTGVHVGDGVDTFAVDADQTNASQTCRMIVESALSGGGIAGGTTVAVTGLPASQGERVQVQAFTGLLTVDQHSTAYHRNKTLASFSSGTTPATTYPNEVLFAAVGVAESTSAPSWTTGWTPLQSLRPTDNPLSVATQNVATSSHEAATGSATGRWVAVIVTFGIASGDPSPSPSDSPTPTDTPTDTPTATPTPTPTPTPTDTPTPSPTPAPPPTSPCTASTCKTCDVTQAPYNADNTGQHDATLAIRQAILACESTQGTPVPNVVWFPSGTYALNLIDNTTLRNDLLLKGPYPVIFAGQGRIGDAYPTTIVQHVGVNDPQDCSYNYAMTGGCASHEGTCVKYSDPKLNTCWTKNILSVQDGASGSTIENISLDTRQYDAGTSLAVLANNVTVQHVSTAHLAAAGAGAPQFPIYYSGNGGDRTTPCATHAANCHWGNVINDLVAYDQECDDGIVLALQGNLTVNDLRYQGSRMAIYVDSNLHVNNFDYTPGIQACGTTQGFAETSPSDHIYINDYVDHDTAKAGGGGVAGNSEAGYNYMTDTMTISGYQILGAAANDLRLGNVNGFTVQPSADMPCDFGPGTELRISPSTSIADVTVQSCTLSRTAVSLPKGATISGGLTYAGVTYNKQAQQTYSFLDATSTPTVVHWSGGQYQNCPNSTRYLTNSSAYQFSVPSGASPPSGYPC